MYNICIYIFWSSTLVNGHIPARAVFWHVHEVEFRYQWVEMAFEPVYVMLIGTLGLSVPLSTY